MVVITENIEISTFLKFILLLPINFLIKIQIFFIFIIITITALEFIITAILTIIILILTFIRFEKVTFLIVFSKFYNNALTTILQCLK